MVLLKAKWGKNEFDVRIPDQSNTSLRRDCILDIVNMNTNIPKDKIKILPPSVLTSPALKDGTKIIVMGTAEDNQLPTAPSPHEIPRFIEDMTDQEIAAALRLRKSDPLPCGFENLGNTCYLNSVVQCLVSLPELRDRLTASMPAEGNVQIIGQLRQLILSIGSSASDSISPAGFVQVVRTVFPQFNQRDNHGHFAQQDADEFLKSLVHSLSNHVDSLFRFTTESTWKCLDAASTDPVNKTHEELGSLTCHMGTQLEPVSHLSEGLKASLREVVAKESASLANRSVDFEKVSGLTSLPQYLIVQFARFQWKAKSDSAGTEATKTKIVRRVTFQKTLDVYDLCTDSVKKSLDVGRERRRVLLESGANLEDVQRPTSMEDSGSELATGVYELVAITSHEGRTADSGHYMSFTKRPRSRVVDEPPAPKKPNKSSAQEDLWVKFDDDYVSETTWTAMTETGGLMGGLADSQMAYILFYAKTTVTKE
jgi:ubiquitin carboxyl-terminal hydrolase 14